jgi:hypothetical protein
MGKDKSDDDRNVIFKSKSYNVTDYPPNSPATTIDQQHILDSGCSETYIGIHDSDLITDMRECADGPTVLLPNGAHLKATHSGLLNLTSLPIAARRCYVLPGLSKSLVSVGALADAGLTTTFTATDATVTDEHGIVLLRGSRCDRNGLWTIPITPNAPHDEANNATSTRRSKDEAAEWLHAIMGSPDSRAMKECLKRNYISFPGTSYEDYLKHEPNSEATAKGHMRGKAFKPHGKKYAHNDFDDFFPIGLFEKKKPISHMEHAIAHVMKIDIPDIQQGLHSDLTGRLPFTSDNGFDYILAFYCPYANYTHIQLMRNRSAAEYIAAHKRAHEFFLSRGIRIEFSRTDNESSKELETWCAAQSPPVIVQKVPPNVHRGNRSEKEVGTVKNHLIAMINTAHPDYPLCAWEHIIPQAEIGLNLLRQSGISYFMSAYQQLHGAYDFVKHPMAPAGTKVIVFDPKGTRGTWANKGTNAFYVGPALQHVGCYTVYVPETMATRVTDTLSWHPHPRYKLPGASPIDALTASLDVIADLLKLHGEDILSSIRTVAPASGTSLAAMYDYIAKTHGAAGQGGTLQGVPSSSTVSPPPPALPAPDAVAQDDRRLAQKFLLEDAAARKTAEETRASRDLAEKLQLDDIAEQERTRAPPEDAAFASELAEAETPPAPPIAQPPTVGDYHKVAKGGRRRTKKPKATSQSLPPPAVILPPPPPAPADATSADRTQKNRSKRTPTKQGKYGVGFRFMQVFNSGTFVGEVVSINHAKGGAVTRHVIYNDGDEADLHHWEITAHVKRNGSVSDSRANAAMSEAQPTSGRRTTYQPRHDKWWGSNSRGTLKIILKRSKDQLRKDRKSEANAVTVELGDQTYARENAAIDYYADHLLELADEHNISVSAVASTSDLLKESLANALLPTKGVAPISLKSVLKGPDRDLWLIALSTELNKLLDSKTAAGDNATAVMTPIQPSDLPQGRKVAYYNPQVKLKILIDGMIQRRCRGTYGGNVSDYTGDKSAVVADIATVKLLLNMVVSSKGAYKLTVADLKDFYLGSDLGERKEFMFIRKDQLPADIIERHKLDLFLHMRPTFGHGVLVRCDKTIYGLPQAGLIAQKRLNKLLAEHGYHRCENTPGLYHHETRPTFFTLVVDDFLMACKSDEDRDHLLDVLRLLYEVKVDYKAQRYVGITIHHDIVKHRIEISVPNYIKNTLERFGIEIKTHGTHAPAPSPEKRYYDKTPQEATTDDSPAVGPAEQKFIQEVVGVLGWYARAVDPTIVCAVNKIASRQARPTEAVVKDALQLLDYVATYPDATIVYEPSDMMLQLHSDASWLSESESRSRAAGIFFLLSKDSLGDPDAINGCIDCYSTIIKSVVGSAFEAEYAGLFLAGQNAEGIRNTLNDLGHPQGATPIIADNACAVGIANRVVKQKRSKSIDMRFHWIRDRTDQGHFKITWAAGTRNLADLMTKSHPAKHHMAMRKIYVK